MNDHGLNSKNKSNDYKNDHKTNKSGVQKT